MSILKEITIRLAIFLWLLNHASGQDSDCYFDQNVTAGNTYYIYNPNYPSSYPPGKMCRWTADCSSGYNCQINCTNVRLPESPSCSSDRILISRIGDPQFRGADVYCGQESFSVVSAGQTISLGLVSTQENTGFFSCELTAQQAAS